MELEMAFIRYINNKSQIDDLNFTLSKMKKETMNIITCVICDVPSVQHFDSNLNTCLNCRNNFCKVCECIVSISNCSSNRCGCRYVCPIYQRWDSDFEDAEARFQRTHLCEAKTICNCKCKCDDLLYIVKDATPSESDYFETLIDNNISKIALFENNKINEIDVNNNITCRQLYSYFDSNKILIYFGKIIPNSNLKLLKDIIIDNTQILVISYNNNTWVSKLKDSFNSYKEHIKNIKHKLALFKQKSTVSMKKDKEKEKKDKKLETKQKIEQNLNKRSGLAAPVASSRAMVASSSAAIAEKKRKEKRKEKGKEKVEEKYMQCPNPECDNYIVHYRHHQCHHMKCICGIKFCFVCSKILYDEYGNKIGSCKCVIFCRDNECKCTPCTICKPGEPCDVCDGCPECQL
jgi:hypothetical protein